MNRHFVVNFNIIFRSGIRSKGDAGIFSNTIWSTIYCQRCSYIQWNTSSVITWMSSDYQMHLLKI